MIGFAASIRVFATSIASLTCIVFLLRLFCPSPSAGAHACSQSAMLVLSAFAVFLGHLFVDGDSCCNDFKYRENLLHFVSFGAPAPVLSIISGLGSSSTTIFFEKNCENVPVYYAQCFKIAFGRFCGICATTASMTACTL